ncbi:MAG: hypothetical protein A2Y56_12150 [Candidatus Aminicenantes bacterium RBG_13_63_10]|nr:MAG: hypothetical protein A2Y56_12150 [Candidatus Aminicenantes bacterium RBG_13_63_10]
MNNSRNSDDLGHGRLPLCREPWESYYILRRGILPCCHGNPIIAPLNEWASAWNSPQLREIRRHLSQGKLSPYCLESLGCPIVQRVLREQRENGKSSALPRRPAVLRLLNRLMFRVPGRLVRSWKERRARRRIVS